MTKELIDRTWSLLPKEFKEEVKENYNYAILDREYTKQQILENLFGEHNLTSDAEGEEMLTVSRKRIQRLLESCKMHDERMAYWDLINLFGSKCLPDEEQPKQKDRDNLLADKEGCRWRNDSKCAFDSACYFEPLNPQEPKPAEPKYHKGDKVLCRGRLKMVVSEMMPNRYYRVAMLNGQSPHCKHESDLEPYTELKNQSVQGWR